MSNYQFHQSFYADLAAHDSDSYVDPAELAPEPNPFHFASEEDYADAHYAWRMAPYNQDEDNREYDIDDLGYERDYAREWAGEGPLIR